MMRPKEIRRLQIRLLVLAGFLTLTNLFVDLAYRTRQPEATVHPGETRSRVSPQERDRAEEVARAVLQEFHIPSQRIREKDEEILATIPQGFRFIDFYFRLQQRLQEADGTILRTQEDEKKNRKELTVAVDGEPAFRLVLTAKASVPAVAGQVAILIDDFGYSYNETVRDFICFPEPLTLSILPGLGETARVAREAKLVGREVLVHMPMEPLNESFSDQGLTILAGQDAATVRLRVRQAFALIPNAIGLNNHQGSRVTADARIMRAVLTEVKNENKIFIDSYTNPASVALAVAQSLQVPAARNLLFIDAEDNDEFIEKQLLRLADTSVKQGKVIGIGHVRKRTLTMLQEKIPELKARGIELVPISRLF